MSYIEKQAYNPFQDVQDQLQSMPVDIRIFSLYMKALYADQAIDTSTEGARKFRELLDKSRNDAMVYLKGHLTLSNKLVSSISEYFEYYEALEYEEWVKMLSDILEETIGYRELCQALLKMHEDILVSFKKREDHARVIIQELNHLQMYYEKEKKELEQNAASKKFWAHGLAYVPFVKFVASPLMHAAAESDLASADDRGREAKIQKDTAATVRETLIPALMGFISGISKAAGFYSVMEQELKMFEGKAEKSKSNRKRLYFKIMKRQARDMKSLCQGFYAVIPEVRTDFLAIPTKGIDYNYIERSVEEKKKAIQGKCSVRKLVSKLLKV